MIYGYARVSTKGQESNGTSLDYQEDVLKEYGATTIYRESISGAKLHRPALDELLNIIQDGDEVVVTKLDRIARSTKNGLEIIDRIIEKGCSIRILNMGTFDSSPIGNMMRTMMFAFAEFEREMIKQRTEEGKRKKKEQNPDFKVGRKKKDIPDIDVSGLSVTEACKVLGISRRTWYNRRAEG